MKKRLISMIVMLCILCNLAIFPVASAEMDYEKTYETALQLAKNDLTNLDNLNDAIVMLEQVGSFGFARSYLLYLQQIMAIQSAMPKFETARLMLEVCRDNAEFSADIEQRGFPSCQKLLSYIDAREKEAKGDLDAASAAYRKMSILDAPDRAANLVMQIANATPTPTPVPTPTPTPTPRPTPTPTPTPRPTPTPTPKPTPTPTPTPKPTSTPRLISDRNEFTKKDNYVFFGAYPQTAEGTDQTPIEWLVLDYDSKNNKALLLSRYGLDAQRYNKEDTYVTWEECTLRAWLNSTFLNKAFTAQEQPGILLSDIDNSRSQGYSSTYGGNNTQDKVFLLSPNEANMYFGATYISTYKDINTKSRVAPTAYAKARGADVSSRYKTVDGAAVGRWWLLRLYWGRAAYVGYDGGIHDDKEMDFHYPNAIVRPAIWINLGSDIF